MIRASLPRLGLAALLACAATVAFAQQSQQRSRTTPETRQQQAAPPTQQRGAGSATQQKPGAGSSTAKPAAGQGKPAAGSAGQSKPAAGSAGPGGAQATLLGSFGDWNAYVSGQGRNKLCYALSQPKERLPKDLKRDPAYLFVSFRPADNVRNEIAVVMGFTTKDDGAAEAAIGNTTYTLVTKGGNGWIKNQSEESRVIATMSKGKDMTVKATSGRGNATTDRYSLNGFSQALERARKECS